MKERLLQIFQDGSNRMSSKEYLVPLDLYVE